MKKGLIQISRSKPITKHKLAFDIGRCRPLSNLRSACSVVATAVSTVGSGFLEVCVGLSPIFLEFRGHLGNDALEARFSSRKQGKIIMKRLTRGREEGGEGYKTAMFAAAKKCCTDWSVVMMDQPVLVPPSFQTFSAQWPPSCVATGPGGNAG